MYSSPLACFWIEFDCWAILTGHVVSSLFRTCACQPTFWGIPLWGIPLYTNSRMAELWSFQVSRQYVPLRCIIAIVKCACGGSRCEMCHQFPHWFPHHPSQRWTLPLLGVLLKRLKYYLRTMIRTTLRNPAKKTNPRRSLESRHAILQFWYTKYTPKK